MSRFLRCKKLNLINPSKMVEECMFDMDSILSMSSLELLIGDNFEECTRLVFQDKNVIISHSLADLYEAIDNADPEDTLIDLIALEESIEILNQETSTEQSIDTGDYNYPLYSILIYIYSKSSPEYIRLINNEIYFAIHDLSEDQIRKIIVCPKTTSETETDILNSIETTLTERKTAGSVLRFRKIEEPYLYTTDTYNNFYYEVIVKGIGGYVFKVTDKYVSDYFSAYIENGTLTSQLKKDFIEAFLNVPVGSYLYVENRAEGHNGTCESTGGDGLSQDTMSRIFYWLRNNSKIKTKNNWASTNSWIPADVGDTWRKLIIKRTKE